MTAGFDTLKQSSPPGFRAAWAEAIVEAPVPGPIESIDGGLHFRFCAEGLLVYLAGGPVYAD